MTLGGTSNEHGLGFAGRGARGMSNEGRKGEPTMSELLLKLKSFWNREEGQGLVEYALILVLVSIVAIGALELIGQNVTSVLNVVANHLNPVG